MSDLFDSLRNRGEELVDRPLPAAEVRRLGDRRRRHRTGLRTLGAAVAVAVVTTGGIALGTSRPDAAPPPPAAGQDESPTPRPDPTPDTAPVLTTAIPAGFPLTQGYPAVAPGSDEQELVGPDPTVQPFADAGACGRPLEATEEATDRLAVRFQQPEDYRARELTTYPSVAAARAVLSTLVTGYEDCPREDYAGDPSSALDTDVRRTGLGDQGYVVVHTFESDGYPTVGLEQIHLVRVGNALLRSSTSTEGSPDPQAVDEAVQNESTVLRPVVAAMCVFAGSGCESDRAGEPGYGYGTSSRGDLGGVADEAAAA